MNETSSSSSSLLLLFIFYLISNHPSVESITQISNTIIEHVCENDFLQLQCSHSNETIQIIRSMYGRTSQRICNQHLIYRLWEKTCANIEQSKSQTKSRCQGKSTCQILINNQIFTDPCGSNIPKHFEIHYRCIDREEICTKLFVNCSKSKDLQCVESIQEEFSCQCPSNICQYVDQNLVGFAEDTCPEEKLQGFHWSKTPIGKTRSLPCPSPCTGEISRLCDSSKQWSRVNYTNCQCPMEKYDQLSTHRLANSYVFQCNFWLINRILPEENSCLRSLTNWQGEMTDPFHCLANAFEQMNFHQCFDWKSFGIDFANLAFEIYLPVNKENRFEFFSKRLIVERTEIIKENFRANLPMMVIEKPTSHSIILIEQENDLNSLQTANVTITFHHQSSEIRYQCRAYHSTNFSLNQNSSNMFFACQLLCSNGSHVICQCPFFNPFMHYILQIDRSQTENELMIDNDLNERCVGEERDTPMEKIDRYLKQIPSLTFVKKLLLFIERMIEKRILVSNWTIIQQIQSLAVRVVEITDSFISIDEHLELFVKYYEDSFENSDRSVLINIYPPLKDKPLLFFTLSNVNTPLIFNSRIVTVNPISWKNLSMEQIQITFRHRNTTEQISTCANLNEQMQWTSDGCQLIATNFTHSTCSCQDWTTVGLVMEFSKSTRNSTERRLLFIAKIGSIISIICVLLTILILLLTRTHGNINDDLNHVRNILHTNMFLCLIFVQIFFLFGIDQVKTQINCRISSVLLDYFLLATFSWMFVDGIELFIAIKHVFQIDRIRLLAYSIYSYVFPLLIIVLSITFSSKTSNGFSKYCWLSHDNAFIWAFVVPFVLMILGNLVFFFLSMCPKCNLTEYEKKLRHSLRDISLISTLFGITWLIAIFYLYDQTISFAYVFTSLNALHGLLIFFVYHFSLVHFRILGERVHRYHMYCRSFFDCPPSKETSHNKSFECFSLPDNTSTSGYSSGHSSDLNSKHPLCQQATTPVAQPFLTRSLYQNRRIGMNNESCYLPSVSINLLSNRLSTFRYPLPSNDVLLTSEQNEEFIRKTPLLEDDHQYYEIR